ncbi:hypothetical protein ACWKSP_26355 [Micromonosporaceae bacterium Da 78-11]
MAEGFTEDDVRVAAAAISRYDWDNQLSANGRISRHQRGEARAALEALAAVGRLHDQVSTTAGTSLSGDSDA